MRAGKLDKLVTIETPTRVRGAAGGYTTTWSTHATAWASINPIRSREYFATQQEQGEVTHRIIIRYISGVTYEMRVAYDGRLFYLQGPPRNIGEKDRQLELMVTEEG